MLQAASDILRACDSPVQAVLGEAALPTRGRFLQEVSLRYEPGVVVEGPAAVVARRTRFIWSLELNEEGCWQVTDLPLVLPFQAVSLHKPMPPSSRNMDGASGAVGYRASGVKSLYATHFPNDG